MIKKLSGLCKLFLLIGSAVIVFLLFPLIITLKVSNIKTIQAIDGVVDLSGYTIEDFKGDVFAIKGEWEYYPNELYTPSDFSAGTIKETLIINYPHFWKDSNSEIAGGRGYATYRVRAILPEFLHSIGIYSRFQYNSYEIYVNQEQIARVGTLSTDSNEHEVDYNPAVGYYYLDPKLNNNYIDIILRVQCYEHVNGGFSNPLMIGAVDAIDYMQAYLLVVNGVIIGLYMILFIYFFFGFWKNRSRRDYFNFMIVTVLCLYVSVTTFGENLLYNLVPVLNSSFVVKLEYISVTYAAYFASTTLREKYFKNKKYERFLNAFMVLLTIFNFALPCYYVSMFHWVHILASLFLFLIPFLWSVRSLFKEVSSENLFETVSILVVLLGSAVNRLGIAPWESVDLFSLAICIHCIMQMIAFFHYNDMVESDLTNLTETLEQKIEERTYELKVITEKAEAAAASKSDFLALMSHEIRTPMNAIIGMSELIETDNLNDVQKRYFYDIRKMSKSLLQIINDILDFSKIEAKKLSLVPVDFNLYMMLDNINSIIYFSAISKELSFKMQIDEDVPEIVLGDEVRIRQILTNLLSNAVKYTKHGHVHFKTYISEDKDGTKRLCFDVEDSGIGIKEEDRGRIFSSFEQLDTVANKNVGGTGLGLVISKQLACMMGGDIDFVSTYGEGSIFTFQMPLLLGDKDKIIIPAEIETVIAENAKILVVDDIQINLTVAMGILGRHKIIPDTALSGLDAIRMIQEKDYDIVFMDHMMPGIDGMEATKRIRELGGKFEMLPIIALTANVAGNAKESFIAGGMNDCVAKPIDRKEMNRVLLEYLPKDKIKYSVSKNVSISDAKTDSKLLNRLSEFPELDVSVGLSNSGDDEAVYLSLIRMFVTSVDKYIDEFQYYLDRKEWKEYGIRVHGVKGALANIGAGELANEAYMLELASKEGYFDFCLERTEAYYERMKAFIQKLSAALPVLEDGVVKVNGTLAQLHKLLLRMKVACASADCMEVDKIVSELEHYWFGADAENIISEVIRLVNDMDYDIAITKVQEYLNS